MKKFKNMSKFAGTKARWAKLVADAVNPLLVADIGVPLHDLKKDGITQSMISTYLKCPRQFLFKMNRLSSEGKRTSFAFGSITHDTLDKIYKWYMDHGKLPSILQIKEWVFTYPKTHERWLPSTSSIEEQQKYMGVCYVVVTEYVRFYKKIDFIPGRLVGAEDVFDVKYNGYRLRGKKDLRFNIHGKRWIMETKTSSRISEDDLKDALSLNLQNLFYVTAEELESAVHVMGVLYNIVRNPGLKFKENSLEDYCNRIRKDIRKRPDFYFLRFEVPYTSQDKRDFKQDLDQILSSIDTKLRTAQRNFYRNSTSCLGKFKCSFLSACTSGKLIGYVQSKSLFKELEEL